MTTNISPVAQAQDDVRRRSASMDTHNSTAEQGEGQMASQLAN